MDQFSKDIRELFNSKTGERILANMESAYREGQRSIYLEIKNVVEKNNE